MKKIAWMLLCSSLMTIGVANASVINKPDMVTIKKVFKKVETMKYSNRTPVSEPSAYKVLFPEMVKVYQKGVKKPQLLKTGLKVEIPKKVNKVKPEETKKQISHKSPVKTIQKVKDTAKNKNHKEKVKKKGQQIKKK